MPRADHRDRNFAGVCRRVQHLKTLSLVVSPKRWRRVANLHDSGPDDRHFELAFRDDGGAAIRLGDGLHGMRLPLGSRLASRIGPALAKRAQSSCGGPSRS